MAFEFLRRLRPTMPRHDFLDHIRQFDLHRGAVVASWAIVESAIDQINHAGWIRSGGKYSNVVPINFGRKVDLFEKLHRHEPLFAAVSSEGAKLIARLCARLDDRHFLVHGYCLHDTADDTGWKVRRHIFKKDGGIEAVDRRFGDAELRELRRELVDIANQATRYLNALMAEMDKGRVDV